MFTLVFCVIKNRISYDFQKTLLFLRKFFLSTVVKLTTLTKLKYIVLFTSEWVKMTLNRELGILFSGP